MANIKRTSGRMASLAGEVLSDEGASKVQRTLAASTLAQVGNGKESGEAMQALAAKVLSSDKYNATTKELAGSVLSQSR